MSGNNAVRMASPAVAVAACILLSVFSGQAMAETWAICRAIDCDCENINAGLLNIGWIPQCRKAEESIRASCESNHGRITDYCDPVTHGPGAWPLADARDAPPPAMEGALKSAVLIINQALDEGRDRLEVGDEVLTTLEPYTPFMPGFAVVSQATRIRDAGYRASRLAGEALDDISRACRAGEAPVAAIGNLLEAQRALSESVPVRGEDVHKTLSALEKLSGLGIAHDQYRAYGGIIPTTTKVDTSVFGYINRIMKWSKAAESTATYMAGETRRTADFVSDTLSLVPSRAAPAAGGPLQVLFRDLVSWDADMFRQATEGLNVVADAIETCDFDRQRYDAVRGNLERLGRTGPWDRKTASDALKKTVTGIPVLGKIIAYLWPSGD